MESLREIKSSRILVTGAAGLIGSAIIHRLNVLGAGNIVACDIMGGEKWRNLNPLSFVDYIEAAQIEEMLMAGEDPRCRIGNFDYVFHMGAISETDADDHAGLLRWNLGFSVMLRDFCTRFGIRFVYASSAAVFGSNAWNVDDSYETMHTLRPGNKYAWYKQRFDVSNFGGCQFRVVGLRFFNVFGPNEHHKKQQSLVFRLSMAIRAGRKISVFDDGKVKRDFIYVEDAADAAIYIARSGFCGLFSIGRGVPVGWHELALAVAKLAGVSPESCIIHESEKHLSSMMSDGYQMMTRASTDALYRTGWRPLDGSLDKSIRRCLGFTLDGRRLGEK